MDKFLLSIGLAFPNFPNASSTTAAVVVQSFVLTERSVLPVVAVSLDSRDKLNQGTALLKIDGLSEVIYMCHKFAL